MAETQAFASSGTVIYRGVGDDPSNPTSYEAIAEVIDLDGPAFGRNMINVSHMTSPNNEEEHIPGAKTRGPISLSMNFVPSDPGQSVTEDGFLADRDNGTKRQYAIVFNDDDQTTFIVDCYVENFAVTARYGDKVAASAVLRPTGAGVWSTGGV